MYKDYEEWKDILGYEGFYQISNYGGIKNKRGKLLKPSIVGDGYLQAHLSKNGKKFHLLIHLLVADYFLDQKRDGRYLVVDHRDNNKLNNYYKNLQIVTQRVNNSKDSISTSTFTGVSWESSCKKWRSEIRIDGKNKFLGRFNKEEDAAQAYINELNKL